MTRVSADQRMRWSHPYTVELGERPGGWGRDLDRVVDWLIRRHRGRRHDWAMLGLRVYFRHQADAERLARLLERLGCGA
ncbi:hypothetical protein CKO28_00140 [Rhodovibrio sodomensis]|uniref:Uncharacterized protein n=1 Tax=Rhodovibrio sodomensis TaxID=1088 RepID=A0ABS1D7Q0_9PROT|nr:hypothetical protein [Rhodovibrio sodomensis]MBK1666448.1 hypothetical protein [Rhodovibrio sodomensis]